jgi:hypothetical protein
MLRLAPDDYDRLSALAADEGLAVGSKARELMISAMDPQIFGERYHDVEDLLRSVVKKEMETHAERLHKRLYRIGGMSVATIDFMRHMLTDVLELDRQVVEERWRQSEGRGFKFMGTKRDVADEDVGEPGDRAGR